MRPILLHQILVLVVSLSTTACIGAETDATTFFHQHTHDIDVLELQGHLLFAIVAVRIAGVLG